MLEIKGMCMCSLCHRLIFQLYFSKLLVFYLLLSPEATGKVAFTVKLCLTTSEGKGRGTALFWMWSAREHEEVKLG